MTQSEEIYKRALGVINRELGTDMPYFESFDTRNPAIANVVLRVLAPVAHNIMQEDLRHSAYRRFHTPLAYPYLATILQWLEMEPEGDLKATLMAIVSLLTKSRDAERVWQLCQKLQKPHFYYMLLAKLSKFKNVGAEVTNVAVADLLAGRVPEWELQYLNKIRDPRIEEWFDKRLREPQNKSRQPEPIKQLHGSMPPVVLSHRAPDYRKELTSEELNVEDAPAFLSGVAERFAVVLPETFTELRFLDSLKLDRWYTASLKTTSGAHVTIWFRLEDVDVVEIVITADNLHVRVPDSVSS